MQKKKFPHLFAALLFPAFFIYYEILFRVTTVRGLFQIPVGEKIRSIQRTAGPGRRAPIAAGGTGFRAAAVAGINGILRSISATPRVSCAFCGFRRFFLFTPLAHLSSPLMYLH